MSHPTKWNRVDGTPCLIEFTFATAGSYNMICTYQVWKTEATFLGKQFDWTFFLTAGLYNKKNVNVKSNHFQSGFLWIYYSENTLCPIKPNGLGLMGHPVKWKLLSHPQRGGLYRSARYSV